MKVLHISDLHLNTPIAGQSKRILDKFCLFLKSHIEVGVIFDHVFITGDFRNARNEITKHEEIKNAIERIINSVTSDSKKPKLHIVPGNHDYVHIKDDDKEIGTIRKNYIVPDGIFGNADKDLPYMNGRFSHFFWPLCDSIYERKNPWLDQNINPHMLVRDDINDCVFIYVNSSLTSMGNSHDGKLVLGRYYLNDLLKSVESGKTVFFLSHHPLQSLEDEEMTSLLAESSRFIDCHAFWMCGDTHVPSVKTLNNQFEVFQVGKLVSNDVVADFAIYDFNKNDHIISRSIFQYDATLNQGDGGWKQRWCAQVGAPHVKIF